MRAHIWIKYFVGNKKTFCRRQKSLNDEQSAQIQKKKWMKEKEEMDEAKIAREEKRRELLFKKREKEREELNQRLATARLNYSIAQQNLQKVIDKKDSKSEERLQQSSSTKVKYA